MAEPVTKNVSLRPANQLQHNWREDLWPWLVIAALVAVGVYLLRSQGRLWWCSCGRPFLWSGDIWSSHNSQHLLDPYSFTHMLHGLVLCGLLAWACPRLSPAWRLSLAISFEVLWEVIENTEYVIGKYRELTIAQNYYGDTVANSLGDILCFGLGLMLARRLGLWLSVALFLVTEIVLLIWIRDNLLLNVLMLFCPIDAVKAWQLAH